MEGGVGWEGIGLLVDLGVLQIKKPRAEEVEGKLSRGNPPPSNPGKLCFWQTKQHKRRSKSPKKNSSPWVRSKAPFSPTSSLLLRGTNENPKNINSHLSSSNKQPT